MMENQISKSTFVVAAVVLVFWFFTQYVVEIIYWGNLGTFFNSLKVSMISFWIKDWIPIWIISMGLVPALASARGLNEHLKLFSFYFAFFVVSLLAGLYFMLSWGGFSGFPIGNFLSRRTIEWGSTFVVTAAVARVAGHASTSSVSVATERVVGSFLKSVWPPLLFLLSLGAVPFAIGVLAGSALYIISGYLVIMFVSVYGSSAVAFLGSMVILAKYGQRQWLVWLAFASAGLMVLLNLEALVYLQGVEFVFGVIISWVFIFWFCKLFLRCLPPVSDETFT